MRQQAPSHAAEKRDILDGAAATTKTVCLVQDMPDSKNEPLHLLTPSTAPRGCRAVDGCRRPHLCQAMKKVTNIFVVVRFAIISREPASLACIEYRAISPAVRVSEVNKDDISPAESDFLGEITRQTFGDALGRAAEAVERTEVFSIEGLRCWLLFRLLRLHVLNVRHGRPDASARRLWDRWLPVV